MRKLFKRPRVVAVLLLVAIIGAGYVLVPVGDGRISRAACDKIPLGLTPAQIEEIVGQDVNHSFTITSGATTRHGILLYKVWYDEDMNGIHVDFEDGLSNSNRYISSTLSFTERMNRRIMFRSGALRTWLDSHWR